MRVHDLTSEFTAIVRVARDTIDLRARYWAWLDRQRREGVLAPLLDDMERLWSGVSEAPALDEARHLLRHLPSEPPSPRLHAIGARFREVTGTLPDIDVVLVAGLGRPEGYSRFDRGRNTIYLGVDHPSALAHDDHLELILSHELCHAVRDPDPAVLGDYGGEPAMTHDDFVARHPFREHLVSEALATAISELAQPGRPPRRYVYFDEADYAWCEAHRAAIAARMVRALEENEPYHTFFAAGAVGHDAPESVDYWFAFRLGRVALRHEPASALLRMPATVLLQRFLQPCLEELRDGASPAHAELRPDDALDGASLPERVERAYRDYRELLARRPHLALDLERHAAEVVGTTAMPWEAHAFPLLLDADEERHVRWVTEGLLRLIDRVIERYRRDSAVRRFFALPPHLEELVLLEPGFRPHAMVGRFDSFWSGRRLRFLELNANGTAGWPLADALADCALEMPGLGEVLARYGARAEPITSHLFEGLLDAWRQARGGDPPRRIAIVDWPQPSSLPEQQRLARDFTAMGVSAVVASPGELTFDGVTLAAPVGPIDLVYRRLTTLDVIERASELGPLLAAARAGAVVTVGPYSSDVAHSKRMFAFLTHERWQRGLAPAERALVDAHVPWTRMLGPGRTQFEGRLWDLRALALAARERFVLKPAESFEGRGVLLGAETTAAEWEAEVERRFGRAHVTQERVQAPMRRLLVPHGRGPEEVPRWLHLGEFVVGGRLAGFLARVSEELVLSATSGERVLPCLVLTDGESGVGPATP